MNKKVLLYSLIALLIILISIVVFSSYSYKMSPDIISVKSMSIEKNILKISIINNNEKGYFKEIKSKVKDDTLYIYVIGTGFKFLNNDNDNNSHTYEKDVSNIKKIYISGRGINTLIYEIKDI